MGLAQLAQRVGFQRQAPSMGQALEQRYSLMQPKTFLPAVDELAFRRWWRENQDMHRQGPDPDAPHFYDYLGAWLQGLLPTPAERHWSSQWKSPMSPERYLLGQSGRVYDSMRDDPEEPYGYMMDLE